MRLIRAGFVFSMVVAAVQAATLVQLSMDQMTQQATAVVRAKVTTVSVTINGSNVYTHYGLNASEVWKGVAPSEVALPGGASGTIRQHFPGVPELKVGSEYVLFLWTSPTTGIVHPLGLTQGIFEVSTQADGTAMAARRPSGELMLDASGKRVSDQSVSMVLGAMKARVKGSGPVQ